MPDDVGAGRSAMAPGTGALLEQCTRSLRAGYDIRQLTLRKFQKAAPNTAVQIPMQAASKLKRTYPWFALGFTAWHPDW